MIQKFLLFFLFIFLHNICFSQQEKQITKTDSLLNLSDNYINIDYKKSLQYAEEALIIAKKENNSNNKVRAYYYAAKSLVFFRQFEKASQYIEKGLQENALKNDNLLKANYYTLQASYYSRMSLFEQQFNYLRKALMLLKSKKDIESQILTSNIYTYFADYYTELQDYKLANIYSDKSISIIEKIPINKYLSTKKIYKNKAFIYFYKSWIYLEQKNPHLAYPFIVKAYNQAVLEKIDYMALFNEIYGDYYYQTNDYKKALNFYLKAVDNKIKFGQNHANIDTKIADTYKKIGNSNNEIYFLKRAEHRRKIDQKEYNKIIRNELNRIVVKKNIEKKESYNKITIITLAFCILLIVLILRIRIVRKRKRGIIKEREKKIEELQQKVTDTFSELNELAKENSPHFWGRFQEIHPYFVQKLLKINPNLKTSELTLCAYIYLGFSNKEIAEYTFKAIRTIENNRYNLRKKINLNSTEDLTVWLRKYIDETS